MEFVKLVLRCMLVVAGTGAIVGVGSALICQEVIVYGRPPAFGDVPVPLLGFLWGFLEFLTPGVVVGLAIAMAANLGERPAIKAMFFRKPLWAHAVVLIGLAVIAGFIGWFAVKQGYWFVLGNVAAATPPERVPLLGAVWWATRGAHIANIGSGIAMAIWTWKKRGEFDALVKSGRG